jgi:hypothetical protein
MQVRRRVGDYLRSIPPQRRYLFIIAFWAVVFGSLIAFDVLFFRSYVSANWAPVEDINYYRYRTQGLLDGQWLYRDIPCESPPLIVYFMIPAQLAGGGYLAYQVWFSFFSLLSALVLYWGLRMRDDYKAFLVALLFLIVPIGTLETTLGIQDETIGVFLFLTAVILAVLNRTRLSAMAVGVGAWTKLINALFYPVLFIKTRSWKERGIQLLIIGAVSLAVSLPYLIVCPTQFLAFPKYYFFGTGDNPAGGASIWDFLSMAGVNIPSYVFLGVIIGAYVAALVVVWRRDLSLLQGALLVLVVFLVFYSRIAVAYYMLPVALLLIWGVENRAIVWRCMLLYFPLVLSVPFSSSNIYKQPLIDTPYGWAIGLALTLFALLLFLDATRLAFRKANFVDRGSAQEGGA